MQLAIASGIAVGLALTALAILITRLRAPREVVAAKEAPRPGVLPSGAGGAGALSISPAAPETSGPPVWPALAGAPADDFLEPPTTHFQRGNEIWALPTERAPAQPRAPRVSPMAHGTPLPRDLFTLPPAPPPVPPLPARRKRRVPAAYAETTLEPRAKTLLDKLPFEEAPTSARLPRESGDEPAEATAVQIPRRARKRHGAHPRLIPRAAVGQLA